MNMQTEDTQLEYELQDLYISTKHWLSDISFVADEIRFFKDLIDKYFIPGSNNEYTIEVKALRKMISQKEINSVIFKNKVITYLKFLEPFINDLNKEIDINLIERHTMLENEINDLLESIQQFKRDLFSLAEKLM
jgi:hypothetical protein